MIGMPFEREELGASEPITWSRFFNGTPQSPVRTENPEGATGNATGAPSSWGLQEPEARSLQSGFANQKQSRMGQCRTRSNVL